MKGIEEGELDIIQQIHISGISISNWTHFIWGVAFTVVVISVCYFPLIWTGVAIYNLKIKRYLLYFYPLLPLSSVEAFLCKGSPQI